MQVPFFDGTIQTRRLQSKLDARIGKVLESGQFILGNEVMDLEVAISRYTGAKHAIGVANGSDALLLGMMAMQLEPGSEVITTPFTFFASTACITRAGHKPVFADVIEDTYNIDPVQVAAAVTKKTKAILPVDLFTQMADYKSLAAIAEEHNLKIIEDSAEAFGMSFEGISAGIAGDVGVYSFFPTKTLGAFGDAGMVTTNDDTVADYIRTGRNHGAPKKYHHKFVGMNSRLDALQAAVLNVKMETIDDDIAARATIAAMYNEKLAGMHELKTPVIANGAEPVWYVYSVQCDRRNDLAKHLKEKGIGTSVYYPIPMHLQECFAELGYKKGDFPVAERLCERAMALPIFVGMTEEQVNYVCETIKSFYTNP